MRFGLLLTPRGGCSLIRSSRSLRGSAPIISGASTPSSISIQGSNPATINVRDTYTDLGAIVHDNQGHDLSYRTFINGALSGNIVIDTSQAATDTIDYVATDTWGNTSTSTRTIIISAPTASNTLSASASSTTATSSLSSGN